MKIITIAKHKGGLGASTLAWSLSSIWAKTLKVLAWDFDPQQTLTMSLAAESKYTGYDVLTGKQLITDAITSALSSYPGTLKIVTATGMLARLDQETISNFDRYHMVADALEKLDQEFDIVIMDTPPSEGSILTIAPMVAADFVLLPCSCDDASFQQIPRIRQTVELVKKRLNSKLVELPIAINMFDQRLSMDQQVREALTKNYTTFRTVILRRTSIREEMAAGVPCTNPELIALAKEILEHL